MAGSGFFLGGAAEGALSAQKMALAERELNENTALRSRGLDLQGRQLEHNIGQDTIKQADAQIAQTMAVVADTIKAGLEGGADPAKVRATVEPLVRSAQSIAARIGRDPAALTAQTDAQLAAPGPVSTARTKGTASAAQRVAEAHGIATATGQGVDISPFKEEKDRVTLENTLRDDFTKASKDFVVVRDFFDRMKTAPTTGAGDLALVFSYMKMLDPASTVREGEQASASNAAGVPAAITGLYNQLRGGGRLADEARTQLKAAAGKIWSSALSRHSATVDQYRGIAKRQGLRSSNVIVDLTAGSEGPTRGTTSTGINWNLGSVPVPVR